MIKIIAYMPIILVLTPNNEFTESDVDISYINRISCDTEIFNHEWCIDGTYYTLFSINDDGDSGVYIFPPPLDSISYKRVIVVSSSESIVSNSNISNGIINDVTITDWETLEDEIYGTNGSDDDSSNHTTDETYDAFYESLYDSEKELSEDEYVRE